MVSDYERQKAIESLNAERRVSQIAGAISLAGIGVLYFATKYHSKWGLIIGAIAAFFGGSLKFWRKFYEI